jgi:hypothetical protein
MYPKGGKSKMQALFTLTPSESKRLIGKAVAAMPEVQNAKEKGYLIIGRDSTNIYITEGKKREGLPGWLSEKHFTGNKLQPFCGPKNSVRIFRQPQNQMRP